MFPVLTIPHMKLIVGVMETMRVNLLTVCHNYVPVLL